SNMARVSFSCACCLRAIWTPEEIEQHARSQKIDAELERDRHRYRRQVKLLLLGAGESGKSTFLKQMRIIHSYGFSDRELEDFRQTIYKNVVMGMKVLLDARDKLRIPWGDPSRESYGQHIMKFMPSMSLDHHVFLDYVPSVKELWKDSGIQQAYNRRSDFQLAAGIFFKNKVAGKLAYVPTEVDILYSRKATKAITEFTIPIQNVPFLFVDVGGQRTQRQKWFQCFESVTSILFLASSSEFDQRLLEDRTSRRALKNSVVKISKISSERGFGSVRLTSLFSENQVPVLSIAKGRRCICTYFGKKKSPIYYKNKEA
ncbi:unnamed protein product, partial [Meganyctiphanes norvegica]